MSESVVTFRTAEGGDADARFVLWSADGQRDLAAIAGVMRSIALTPGRKIDIRR
jgi:hypothetical protein